MSVSSDDEEEEEEEISNGDRDGYQGGGSDGDDDSDDVIGKKKKKKKKHSKNPGRSFGKRIVLYPFTAAKNKIRRIRSKRALLSSSSSLSTTTISTSSSSSSRNVINVHTRRGKVIIHKDATTSSGCNFCFSRPDVLETPNVSPSDPNHPSFTHSMFKTLIENNDFYSKQCNTHIH